MNKNITEEELLLRKRARRRLVGAIVLVLVAVIVLPLIFDESGPDVETHEIDIHLSAEDEVSEAPPLVLPSEDFPPMNADQPNEQFELAPEPEPTPTPELTDALQQIVPLDDVEDSVVSVELSNIPIPGIKPKSATVRTERVEQVIQSNDISEEYVIQLGAFSDQSKAEQQLNNLRANGLNAYTETHLTDGHIITRVRVGPYSSRVAAENELEKFKRQGLEGVVIPR